MAKPGKVIRLNKRIYERIKAHRERGETWSETLEKLLLSPGPSMWTLPSKLVPTRAEANGIAISEAAKDGIPLEERELPIQVYSGDDL